MITSRPPRKCLQPGCPTIGNWDRGYCGDHSRLTAGGSLRKFEKLYRQTKWLKIFRPRFLQLNPICQRVVGKGQCHAPSSILHHLIDPETLEMFWNPRNIVATCVNHHPGGQPGTPYWREGLDYVPTVWSLPSFG